ncbi:hypothetical protein JYQ62_22140 [Nostoc sp. UHCC 0702]|nr:hypothetical protein JYQ62_22140 [Nostoc sp. UHCC 0702]
MTVNQSARQTKITIDGNDFSSALISFAGSDNHIDQSGLISFTGTVTLGNENSLNESLDDRINFSRFCRGNQILISIANESGIITRHPRGALRIISPHYDYSTRQQTIEVADLITALSFKEPTDPEKAKITVGKNRSVAAIIRDLLTECGIRNVDGDLPDTTINYPLDNLSGSYLQAVGQLLYANNRVAWIDSNEVFRIEKVKIKGSTPKLFVKIGSDEIWYNRLAGAEQPAAIIKTVATLRQPVANPSERTDYSVSYGIASYVDPAYGNFQIIMEETNKQEVYDKDLSELTITTQVRKPLGLIVPDAVVKAVLLRLLDKTVLNDYEYRVETFYYEKGSECKLKSKVEKVYRNLGNLYREVITGKSGGSGYSTIILKLGLSKVITTTYEYTNEDILSRKTTITQEHILAALSDTDEDWSAWGLGYLLDYLITSSISTEEWKQLSKGVSPTWSYRISNSQVLARVKPDIATKGPQGNKTALVDDGTSKYEISNSGQLSPPAAERCPVNFNIQEQNIEGKAKFQDPCNSDLKPRERTYQVDMLPSGLEIAKSKLNEIASREGRLLLGRWKGQNLACAMHNVWFSYTPLMCVAAIEKDNSVQSFLVDGASWVVGQTKALVSFDGVWIGKSSPLPIEVGNETITITPPSLPYIEITIFEGGSGCGGEMLSRLYSVNPVTRTFQGGVGTGGSFGVAVTSNFEGGVGTGGSFGAAVTRSFEGGIGTGGDFITSTTSVFNGGVGAGADCIVAASTVFQAGVGAGASFLPPVLAAFAGGVGAGASLIPPVLAAFTGGVGVGGNFLASVATLFTGGVGAGGDFEVQLSQKLGILREIVTVAISDMAGSSSNLSNNLYLGNCYLLLKLSCSVPIRARFYTDSASQSSDLSRPIGGTKATNNGLICEVVFASDLLQINVNPIAVANVNLSTYLTITNLSSAAQNVVLTIHYITLLE